jgi:hypothetical protein
MCGSVCFRQLENSDSRLGQDVNLTQRLYHMFTTQAQATRCLLSHAYLLYPCVSPVESLISVDLDRY